MRATPSLADIDRASPLTAEAVGERYLSLLRDLIAIRPCPELLGEIAAVSKWLAEVVR